MIQLATTSATVVSAGQAITFDSTPLKTGCAECTRANTGSVKLRSNGIYVVTFSGNIGATTATTAAQLSIQLGGVTISDSTMISMTTAAGDLNNVSVAIPIKNCCGDYDRVTVVNTGTADINVGAGATLFVRRVS